MKRELIRLENVSKRFGALTVLDEINLTVHENEFVTLLGPSGCGKTTLLRIIGGFETPDSGQILFDGKDITAVPPNRRPINTVFQKYSLFSHMNVAENIAFGFYTAIHPLEPERRNAGYEMAQPITLGDNVWIGGGVTILPGVKIGKNSVVGAGAVVTKDIPEGVLAYGNPCKVIKQLS